MVGDNEAVQPVKGDVARYVQGGYKPVGATSDQVLTQSPDWDGINKGIGMLPNLFADYARSQGAGPGGGSSSGKKQDYSGQYQVEMNDIAANPEYHNTNGTYNSKGQEAIRALNQKYAPYVSGAEIRATESYVGGGYKESVDSALRQKFIDLKASDYEAQNKEALTVVSQAHPEYSQLPIETRINIGNKLIERSNASIALQNTIKNSDNPQVIDSAIKSIADNEIKSLSEETIMRLKTVGVTTKDRQDLVDLWYSIGIQNLGWSPQDAQINAIRTADGTIGRLREYQKDLTSQMEDEIKFTVNDAKLKLINSDPKLLAYYSATNGQIPPDALANLITGNIQFGDAYRTVEKPDGTYSRQLIVNDKNIRNFGLNYGNEATASATLANTFPEIEAALSEGNSEPLLQLRNLPRLKGILQAKNQSEDFVRMKQNMANDFSLVIANNARHYYKGGNEINEDMAKHISDAIHTASYLGYTNEECQDIVNKAMLNLGMKPIKGIHTPEELDHSIGASLTRIGNWIFSKEKEPEEESTDLGIDINEYLPEELKTPVTEDQQTEEQTASEKPSVFTTPEYRQRVQEVVKDFRAGRMTAEQAKNELIQFVDSYNNDNFANFKRAAGKVGSALNNLFGVKGAEAGTKTPPVPGPRPNFVTGEERRQSIAIVKDKYNSSDKKAESLVDDKAKRYSNGNIAKTAIKFTLPMVNPKRARDIIAYVLYDECRGEDKDGQDAVASVMCNRIGTNRGEDILDVVTRAGQFSGLNGMSNSDLFNFLPKTKVDQRFYEIADQLLDGTFVPTTDATSYYNPLHQSKASKAWTSKLTDTVRIGKHVFGKDKSIIKQS